MRLLYNNGRTVDSSIYRIHYRNATVSEVNTYCYASMFRVNNNIVTDTLLFDLPLEYFTTSDITDNYNITLYNKYHQLQISDLLDENIMIMEAKINLCEDDINALDFRRPIFVESVYGNSYFKLLECEYSGSETLATAKSQRIIK